MSNPEFPWTVTRKEFRIGDSEEAGFDVQATFDPEWKVWHVGMNLGATGERDLADAVRALAEQCRRFLAVVEGEPEATARPEPWATPHPYTGGGCEDVCTGSELRCFGPVGHEGPHMAWDAKTRPVFWGPSGLEESERWGRMWLEGMTDPRRPSEAVEVVPEEDPR